MQSLPPLVNAARFDIDCRLEYDLDAVCDFVFMVHASQTSEQRVLSEQLTLTPDTASRVFVDGAGNRLLRLQSPAGHLSLRYQATVERACPQEDIAAPEWGVHDMPDEVLQHLQPTRYCESDLLNPEAIKLFSRMAPGYQRVAGICDWIKQNIEYKLGSTDSTTTAQQVFTRRAGVCRDFAHLGIALCRGLNIPARLVSGYAPFEDPPPDFHAVFEAFLGGRWVLFDPTQMAPVQSLIRIATGRDAKDVAFASIFGPARMTSMSPEIAPQQAPPGAA